MEGLQAYHPSFPPKYFVSLLSATKFNKLIYFLAKDTSIRKCYFVFFSSFRCHAEVDFINSLSTSAFFCVCGTWIFDWFHCPLPFLVLKAFDDNLVPFLALTPRVLLTCLHSTLSPCFSPMFLWRVKSNHNPEYNFILYYMQRQPAAFPLYVIQL